MADDIALTLRGTSLDSVAPGSQIRVRPLAVVDCMRTLVCELAVRPEKLHRHLLHSLIHLAPEYFLDGSLGAGDSGLVHSGEGAHLIEPEDFDLGVDLCQLLSNNRVTAGNTTIAFDRAGEFYEPFDLALECYLQARSKRAALEHQGCDCDVPSAVDLAYYIFEGTRTSWKITSLNSDSPVICLSGRTETPGLCISTSM